MPPKSPVNPPQGSGSFQPAGRGATFWILLAAILAAQLWPLWAVPFFPSVDGPLHIYNASVLLWHAKWEAVREYFDLHFSLAGNLGGQFLLAGLMSFLKPLTAEKLVVTLILALYALSAWFLPRVFRSGAPETGLWVVLLAPGELLFMGFWNFCLATGVLLATAALVAHAAGRQGRLWVAGVALLSGAIYFSHSVAWAATVATALLSLIWLWWLKQRSEPRARWREDARRMGSLAAALCWPLVILAYYLLTSEKMAVEMDQPFRMKAWTFYSGAFLGMNPPARMLRLLFMCHLAAMSALAVFLRWRRRAGPAPSDFLLLASGLFLLATLFAPDQLASGAYFTTRYALLAALALMGWLGCQPWPGWARAASVLGLMAAVLLQARANWIEVSRWQPAIRELAALGARIPEGSVVLPVLANRDRSGTIDPLLHAAGYWSPKDFVYLRNHQGLKPHFCVAFKPGYSPETALGEPKELDLAPARFSIDRYEALRKGRVDRVIVYGPFPERIAADLPQQAWDPEGTFELEAVSQPGGYAWIYRRRANSGAP
ncbi:MAG: hypothetical protein WHT08_03410 [Bryobacteraceae bacterium]